MTFEGGASQTVALDRDLPEHGLGKGDLGAVFEIYKPDDLAVEFVMADGITCALLTLQECDVRPVASTDLSAVRPFTKRTA